MSALPSWCSTPIGRALIAEIIAEQPDTGPSSYTLPSTFGGYRESCEPQYRGKVAAQLRRLHREWVERELARLDAQYRETCAWDQQASDAIFRTEDADKLIARAMHEGALTRTVEIMANASHRVTRQSASPVSRSRPSGRVPTFAREKRA